MTWTLDRVVSSLYVRRRDQTSRTEAFAMLLTAAACMGLSNIARGFALGLAMAWCLRLGIFRVEEREGAK
jgi:hypothetical protein